MSARETKPKNRRGSPEAIEKRRAARRFNAIILGARRKRSAVPPPPSVPVDVSIVDWIRRAYSSGVALAH